MTELDIYTQMNDLETELRLSNAQLGSAGAKVYELQQALEASEKARTAEVARLTAAGDGMERVINDNGYEPDSKFEYAVARWAALRQPAPAPATKE